MLSRTGEYALRAVLLLAQRGEGAVVPSEAIARELGVPSNYLSKTLHRLARNGVLESEKGRKGGFRLARRPEDVPVSEVVADFEAQSRERRCVMDGGRCDDENPCVAHVQWMQWSTALERRLVEMTVADFLRPDDAGEGAAPAGGADERRRDGGSQPIRRVEERAKS